MDRLRAQLAVGIFIVGIFASVCYVPMTICYNLGFRGTNTEDTYCEFQDYYLSWERPTAPHTDKTQIRLDHGRLGFNILILAGVCLLIAAPYSRLFRTS